MAPEPAQHDIEPTLVAKEAQDTSRLTALVMVDSGMNPGPQPIEKKIGNVTATGPDVTGTNVQLAKEATTVITAAIDGDADDATYKWTVRSGNEYVSISGSSDLKAVTLSGDAGGLATVRCTVSSVTASDSPQQVTLSVTVTEPSGPEKAKSGGKK